MKIHYTLENLNDVKLAFHGEGDPHLNGESTLVIDIPKGLVKLKTEKDVIYEAKLEEVMTEAMELLQIAAEVIPIGR